MTAGTVAWPACKMKNSTPAYLMIAAIILSGCASGLSDESIYAADGGYGYYYGPGYYDFYDPYNDLFLDDYGFYGSGLYGGYYGYGYGGLGFRGGRLGAGGGRGSLHGGFHGNGGIHDGGFHGGGFHSGGFHSGGFHGGGGGGFHGGGGGGFHGGGGHAGR